MQTYQKTLIDKNNALNQSKEVEKLTKDLKRFSLENQKHKEKYKEIENSEKKDKSKINMLIIRQVQHEHERIKILEAEKEGMKNIIAKLKKEKHVKIKSITKVCLNLKLEGNSNIY